MSSPRWIPGVNSGSSEASIPPAETTSGMSPGGGVAVVICGIVVLAMGLLYVRWIFQWLNEFVSRNEPPEPPHLESKSIAALPTFAYCRASTVVAAAVAAECSICLGAMSDGEVMRELPGCGHVFHRDCIDVWLRSRSTCPICRDDLLKPEEDDSTAASPLSTLIPI